MQRYLYSELDRSKRDPINQILFLKHVYKTFDDARLFLSLLSLQCFGAYGLLWVTEVISSYSGNIARRDPSVIFEASQNGNNARFNTK